MRILNTTEQDKFDNPPIFNSHDRKKYFSFPKEIIERSKNFSSQDHKIGFLLTYGYFRASQKFYKPSKFHVRDIQFLTKSNDSVSINYPDRTRQRHKKEILHYFGYKRFGRETEACIKSELSKVVQIQLKPKLIFWRCVDLLIKNRTAIPKYNHLSDLILTALNDRKKLLSQIIDKELLPESRNVLDQLFDQTSPNDNPKYARYKVTLLKKLSQSVQPTKVKERTDDLNYLKEVYEHIEPILSKLELGYEGIRYYANSVIKSDIFHISRRSHEDRYVHAISFVAHQYCRLQDNLVDVLQIVIQSHQNTTDREYKDWCYENTKQRDKSLKSLLGDNVLNLFATISNVLKNKEASDSDKVQQIQKLLPQSVLDKSEELRLSLEESITDEAYFNIIKKRSVKLQNRLSPIIKSLDFQGESRASNLMKAIDEFKKKDGNINKNTPCEFLNDDDKQAVYADSTFNISLYKVFLFTYVTSAIKSGTLNLKHSYKYRPLDGYMIAKKRWEEEFETLIEQSDLKSFVDIDALLDRLNPSLHQQYQSTNQLYLNEDNPYLKITDSGKFTIATPKQEEYVIDESLQAFFPEQPIPLTEVLSTVNAHTGFLEEFEHWQQQYSKNTETDKALYAGVMGKGCAIGTPKIARISNQINENRLSHVINWYFSLDNIRAANDRVIKLLDRMELPEIYRASKGQLHTASDGQKFTVRTDSLNANYSFKYAGKEQTASAYTFIDERKLLWHSTAFSSADRESHYVIDGLMYNNVVKSDIHSTDTHGYSEVIFAITYLLGLSYAPRIKNLKKQTLYTFKDPKINAFPDWKIKPEKYINTQMIKQTWDDILRLVATIKLKESTASEIFRRLNSYSKQHKLYQALKAFGQIIKSEFILRYLSNVELRQSIEKQLNNVELANRFTRAVAVGDPQGFAYGEKEEQEIAESCNRLIKNAIICWNYLYLSDKLRRLKHNPEQHQILMSAISSHSVMSWGHINLLGEYDFSDERLQDSFNILPPKLILK